MFRIAVTFKHSVGFTSATVYDDLDTAEARVKELNEQYAHIATAPRAHIVFA